MKTFRSCTNIRMLSTKKDSGISKTEYVVFTDTTIYVVIAIYICRLDIKVFQMLGEQGAS